MTSKVGRAIFGFVAVGIVALAGCGSLSDSSKSSSNIISSPSTSSSRSSSPEDAYREDVRDYTAAHVKSGGTTADLRAEIGKLAEKHGISDWEANEATYRGIGEGLGKAGYRQVEVDAFKKNMAETPQQAEWIQKGYDSAN
jgi:hypothetical protein